MLDSYFTHALHDAQNNWRNDLLRHGPAVNEACATDKVEEIDSLGNPELHVTLGPSSHAQLAMPSRIVVGEIPTEQVTLLRQDRAVRLFIQFALVRFNTSGFREEEAVVGGDDDMVAVEVVDDVADYRSQFINRTTHGLEGMSFGLGIVAHRIDRVVVDVDDPLILHELPARP